MTIQSIQDVPAIDEEPRFAKDNRGFGTRAVQAGSPHDPVTGAVIAPVCPPYPAMPCLGAIKNK